VRAGWPRSVGVLGAGALGTLFAHGLVGAGLGGPEAMAGAGPEVVLLARSPGPDWVEVEGRERIALRRVTQPQGPVDLLIVLVKAYATAQALRWAGAAAGPETVALTLQNGLGNAEALALVVGPERVLVGTTAQGATLLEPGRVRHGGSGESLIAPWAAGGAAAASAARVAELLSQAGFPTGVADDARRLLWSKLVVNAAINPLTALLGVENGALLEREDGRRFMARAAREAGAVAAALGIDLGEDPADRAERVAHATARNRSSMLQDLERGRRTEIEAINGAVVQYGRATGVATPVNEALTLLVQAMEGRLA
jgi:2-dehydropantoate 2-reductase